MVKSGYREPMAGGPASQAGDKPIMPMLRKLGGGGMGDVFLSEWRGERVAVKQLQRALLQDARDPENLVARFRREAMAGMRVQHASLVAIRELVEEHGELYLIMDYVEGPTLRSVMNEPLQFHKALRYVKEIAEGLAVLHQAKVIHRDLKPENVLIDQQSRRARLIDYGLARVQDAKTLTTSPQFMGTPGYIAPEQALSKPVDGRADLFSLGVVIYEVMSGRHPFAGGSLMMTAENLVYRPHRPLKDLFPEVPDALHDLVDHLLQKDPVRRPSNAREVLQALRFIELSNYEFTVGSNAIDRPVIGRPSKTMLLRRPNR